MTILMHNMNCFDKCEVATSLFIVIRFYGFQNIKYVMGENMKKRMVSLVDCEAVTNK